MVGMPRVFRDSMVAKVNCRKPNEYMRHDALMGFFRGVPTVHDAPSASPTGSLSGQLAEEKTLPYG
ncbi:MAG: hypothetical protein A4E45_01521 [Methanosaeta sp. PtaB.Bin039]|nr:MAG: hypothetical protein A4E45_01521 [Methanosaeta sp. PtaB.Bin039]